MPRNISYRPVLIDELITNERLNSYRAVFQHSDDAELVGAYLWNTKVCSALYPLLTAAEVTLRNSIDSALCNDLGRFWWKDNRLHYKSFSRGGSDSDLPFCVRAIRKNFLYGFTQAKKDKKRRYNVTNPRPTHHEIIAKTEFSTWEFILDSEFMGSNLIWPKHLGAVFRGQWPSSKASNTLSSTKDLVKTVREFRNRVSHHEPVWKRYGVHKEVDAIAHLHEKLFKITSLISLVSPEKADLLLKSGIISRAERACSINELRRCQYSFEAHNVKSVSKLCRLAQKVAHDNTSEHIIVYKHGKTRCILEPFWSTLIFRITLFRQSWFTKSVSM